MEREAIIILAQLLVGLREAVEKCEEAYNRKDAERLMAIKKEILALQEQIERHL